MVNENLPLPEAKALPYEQQELPVAEAVQAGEREDKQSVEMEQEMVDRNQTDFTSR